MPKLGELSVPVAVLAIVMALITPMPAILLDVLIVLRHHDVGDRADGHHVYL